MGTKVFYGKNGGISSIWSTVKVGNNRVENTSYFKDGKVGVTFRGNHITTRLNSDGKSLGVGIGGTSAKYYNGRSFSSDIPRFR